MFYEEFKAFFTEEEFNTQIVKILTQIGVNVERAVLEEFNAQIRQTTEFIFFDDNRIRSWLAMLLEPVRNVMSANGEVEITIISSTGAVNIEAGYQIQNTKGYLFQVQQNVQIPQGGNATLSVIQGTVTEFTGTYNTIIAIPQVGIDFSTLLEVYINDKQIKPVEMVQTHIKPIDGYYPYYYNDTLFIKIYKGGLDVANQTPDPEGQAFRVRYIISDGALANTPANSFTSFTHQLLDVNSEIVQYEFKNTKINNGNNAPSHWELVNALRKHFLAGFNVSSITEYKIWFLSQPEVGDCIVYGDYEKWIQQGAGDEKGEGLLSTGRVSVLLMDRNGNQIPEIIPESTRPAAGSDLDKVDKRLAAVRDIAIIDYYNFTEVQHCYVLQYDSVSNITEFTVYANNVIKNFYDLNWVRNNDMSLFEPLDVLKIINALIGMYALTGLHVIPYHYREIVTTRDLQVTTYPYAGEKPGGYYLYFNRVWNPVTQEYDRVYHSVEDEDKSIPVSPIMLQEFENAAGDGEIYLIDPLTKLPIVGEQVGLRTEMSVNILLDGRNKLNYHSEDNGLLECYFMIRDPGMVPVGVVNGKRVLKQLTPVYIEQST
jgi:hypothetical protein